MAITQNTYTGNGSSVLYSFTFPYLDSTDVKVTLNDVLTTAYTFANATTIQFNTAPAVGAPIRIYRSTNTDNPESVFFPGSSIKAQDLNDGFTQSLYSVQEWRDQTVPLYNAMLPDDIDMGGNQINNLGEPTLAQDAATKNYVDSTTWNNTTETTQGGEAWISVDTQIPTNLSVDQRIDNKIDIALTTDIAGSDGVTITNDGDGTITVGLGVGSVDFDRIKDVDIITTAEQDAGTPVWPGDETKLATISAAAKRFDTLVQTLTPSGTNWQVGKTWLQNDVNNTLSIWDGGTWKGVASGGTFTTQPTVIYVDSINGNDANDGHRIINPKKTIKNAVASAAAGDIIRVAPGVYQEVLPIDITVANLSIVGEAQRSCFVHPTPATETQVMFRCNSGTYIDGFTFVGLKASGTRGNNAVDNNPTYGLPENQGWVAGFYPDCIVRKSPYINNCSNFADSAINNAAFDPNNYAGTGGDTSSGMTGGGIIVDGSLPAVSSPLRSFVVNEFTQVCLDGPGLLVCNNGYAQAVSFFGLFCHYHAKALSGGQINMEVGTTDFGRYGLIADGKSSSAIFTATANGGASAGATTFAINAPTAGGSWFGDANRPAINMLVQIGADIYPILSSSPNGAGWNVVISRPNPSNRAQNLGLINSHLNGATVSFFLRSMVSTASHTMEYAGSGTNYNALPENGGVPAEGNEVTNLNNGKVWLTSTDQSGKFKVGDTFAVDQQTGFVTIDPNSYSTNLVSDLSPELGGNLDVLTRNIYSSLGNVQINDNLEVTGQISNPTGNVVINDTVELPSGSAAAPSLTFTGDVNTGLFRVGAEVLGVTTNGTSKVTFDDTLAPLKEIYSSVYYPVVTSVDIGSAADQVSLNYMLGDMAFQNAAAISVDQANITTVNIATANTTTANTTTANIATISSVPLLSGGGIQFPATQVASANANTLDDYEEGTWTPTVSSGSGSLTAYNSSGTYTKIGRIVICNSTVTIVTIGTAASYLRISNLPFSATFSPHNSFTGYGRESNTTGKSLSIDHYSPLEFLWQDYNGTFIGANNYIFQIVLVYKV